MGQRYDVLICAKSGPWASDQLPPPVWIRAGILDSDGLPSSPTKAVLYFGDAPPAQLPSTPRAWQAPRLTPIPYSDGRLDLHPHALMVRWLGFSCLLDLHTGQASVYLTGGFCQLCRAWRWPRLSKLIHGPPAVLHLRARRAAL